MTTELTPRQMRKICQEIYEGDMLQAVCLYKEASGKGLKESRQFIEMLTKRLYEETPEKFRNQARPGCASAVLLLAVVAAAYLVP